MSSPTCAPSERTSLHEPSREYGDHDDRPLEHGDVRSVGRGPGAGPAPRRTWAADAGDAPHETMKPPPPPPPPAGSHPHQPHSADPVRSHRHQHLLRPLRHRTPDQGHTEKALLVSTPSNRTVFALLATQLLPDLHVLDPAGRVIPRRQSS